MRPHRFRLRLWIWVPAFLLPASLAVVGLIVIPIVRDEVEKDGLSPSPSDLIAWSSQHKDLADMLRSDHPTEALALERAASYDREAAESLNRADSFAYRALCLTLRLWRFPSTAKIAIVVAISAPFTFLLAASRLLLVRKRGRAAPGLARGGLRLRTLLILIALLGIAMFCAIEERRLSRVSRAYQQAAQTHWAKENYLKMTLRYDFHYFLSCKHDLDHRDKGVDSEETRSLERELRRAEATYLKELQAAEYHATLQRKYERAACYPWLPVTPDPPDPMPMNLVIRPADPDW